MLMAISLMRNECRSNLCCSPLMNPAILIMPSWNSTSRNVSGKLYKIILIILAIIYKSGGITPLNQKDWKGFFVEDVVTILPGRDIYDAERIPGKTPYVSSSSVNNGICHFVNNANDTLEANCISVNRNGSVGFAFYHPYEALFSNDCRKLRPKYEGNYISLFIATQITAQRNKYSYGYKMGTARLKRQKIMLPTTDNGTPDYDYMEQYVRQQIATLKLQYLQGKMTVAI